ncbi:hypothetical protein X975_03491, partial [Stegodyphus mimosarum]
MPGVTQHSPSPQSLVRLHLVPTLASTTRTTKSRVAITKHFMAKRLNIFGCDCCRKIDPFKSSLFFFFHLYLKP